MAKKESAVKKAAAAVAAKHAAAQETATESLKKTTVANPNSKVAHSFSDVGNAVNATYKNYCQTLTPRLKLIDIFLVFLVALGGLQFVYVLLVGNFPFNAFLGGFIACVGQFVLTVSLRMQYASTNKLTEQPGHRWSEKIIIVCNLIINASEGSERQDPSGDI